ncbi:cytidine deaminase [Aurantiacibacter aquimixticola]|uniref:Cytidine deaminase n=1 Tax=Aurantiacibacter aquimixticola TaxID=1958945 RepID=A0A419RW52_9SPHN|nr:cytidine deaminase [Aurantiacibacter aquimixticola]RJY10016.1 cytidine deaminase [Aurantiacibacter aquimixticola]
MSGADRLVEAALQARQKAYAPYSNFLVGAAVESVNGDIAVGANMENACYRLGVCAEQSALAAAAQAFGLGKVARIAVVGGPRGDDTGGGGPITPCGGCRQAIAEAAQQAGCDTEILCCDAAGEDRLTTTIRQLLPAAFTLD